MTDRRITILLTSGIVVAGVLGTACFFKWLIDRPRWELSAKNSDDGVQFTVYKQGEVSPTYSAVLNGRQIARDVQRLTIDELPPDIGETTFSDETLQPGRWMLILDGVEIDIGGASLMLNGGTDGFNRR